MAEANFDDDLMHGFGGCGLFGTCENAVWFYERHADDCRPGMWNVGLAGGELGDFWPMLTQRSHAVVDDFGTLRMVGEPS